VLCAAIFISSFIFVELNFYHFTTRTQELGTYSLTSMRVGPWNAPLPSENGATEAKKKGERDSFRELSIKGAKLANRTPFSLLEVHQFHSEALHLKVPYLADARVCFWFL
jgi:hypothetical protein